MTGGFIVTGITGPSYTIMVKSHIRPTVGAMAIAACTTGRRMPAWLVVTRAAFRHSTRMIEIYQRPATGIVTVLANAAGQRMIFRLSARRFAIVAAYTIVSHIIVIKPG